MSDNGTGYRVLEWRVRDVMGCKSVTIRPRATGITKIKGRNEQGKSSAINALLMALGGGSSQTAEPIRHGQDSGECEVVLAEGLAEKYRVRKLYTKKRTSLEVKANIDGVLVPWPSPQTFLDDVQGAGIGADPGAFCSADPATLVKMVLPLLKMPEDPRTLDLQRKAIFAERTKVNHDVKQAEAVLAAELAKPLPEAPDVEVSVAALATEFAAQQKHAQGNETERGVLRVLIVRANDQAEEVERLRGLLIDAEAELAEVSMNLKDQEERVSALQDPDISALQQQMADAEATNRQVRAKQAQLAERARLQQASTAKDAESQALTDQIDALDKRKADLYAQAKWPVPGMAFENNEAGDYWITMDGIPITQASDSQRMQIGMEVCAASNPKLRLLLFRQGSLLDEDRMAQAEAFLQKRGYQAIVEIVSKDRTEEEGSFIIEAGELVGAEVEK
jgi:hypothetical protein